MRPGAKAALAIWGAAIVWDIFCPKGETVSEAIERGLNDKRTEPIVLGLVVLTAAHLLRVLDERYDVYSIGFRWAGNVIDRRNYERTQDRHA
jgi:hypothetical protein